METYMLLTKLVSALLSGEPICIFDKKSQELNRWILMKKVEIFSDEMIIVEDNEEHRWVAQEWEMMTLEEFNKLSK